MAGTDYSGGDSPGVGAGSTKAPIGVGSDYRQPGIDPTGKPIGTDEVDYTGRVRMGPDLPVPRPAGVSFYGAYGLPQHDPTAGGIPGSYVTHNANGTFYMDGAEQFPLHDANQTLDYQGKLVQAGLLNKKEVTIGVWNDKSANAMRTAMGMANAWGTDVDTAISYLIANPKIGTQAAGREKNIGPALENEADIKDNFRHAAQNLIGQDPSLSMMDQFTKSQRAAEQTARDSYYKADEKHPYTAAPSSSASADQYLEAHDHNDVLAYGAASRMVEFYKMLGVL